MSAHTLSLLVEDVPSVLTRVAGLFARRNFNIKSLAVGNCEIDGMSRITAVVDVDDLSLEQITKQLNKLVNVVKIVELEPSNSVYRQHMLIKVRADANTRAQVLDIARLFDASIADASNDAVVIETTRSAARNKSLLKMLEPYGIREIVQSGLLAVARGGRSMTDRVPHPGIPKNKPTN